MQYERFTILQRGVPDVTTHKSRFVWSGYTFEQEQMVKEVREKWFRERKEERR
jgi:hypothetical protein